MARWLLAEPARWSIFRVMMLQSRQLSTACAALLCLLITGCAFSPQAKEQRFMAERDRQFQAGKFPEALVLKGQIEIHKNQPDQATGTLQQAVKNSADNALATNRLAYLLREHNGNWMAALSLAQTARKRLPKLSNTADTLGWAYDHKGDYALAAPLFEGAVKSMPNSHEGQDRVGKGHQHRCKVGHRAARPPGYQ